MLRLEALVQRGTKRGVVVLSVELWHKEGCCGTERGGCGTERGVVVLRGECVVQDFRAFSEELDVTATEVTHAPQCGHVSAQTVTSHSTLVTSHPTLVTSQDKGVMSYSTLVSRLRIWLSQLLRPRHSCRLCRVRY